MVQSLDHLDAHRGLMEDAQRTHVWAEYTLMRAALETACTAVWLVTPDEPEERRFRLLRLAAKDINDSKDAAKLHRTEPASGRTHKERLDEVKALAPAERRAEVGASLGYRGIVRAAAPAADVEPDFLELQWRILSGLTHGAQWATLGCSTGPPRRLPSMASRTSASPARPRPSRFTGLQQACLLTGKPCTSPDDLRG
ncbi:hypothetical protein E5226_02240 [Cellulomonas shaoxiangyii]|nr:hypothetical protein E5226_02240 [Cellulomonas shaoxiangyii]